MENDYDVGISLKDLIHIVRKNILLIVLITFVCLIIGLFYGFKIKEVKYVAKTYAIVEAEQGTGTNESQSFTYSVNLINTFKEFITFQPVISRAYEKLVSKYPEISKQEIKSSISVSSSQTSLILTISSTTTDGVKSIDIANAVLESAVEYSDDKTIEGHPKFLILSDKLKIVEPAYETQANRGTLKVCIIAVMIGLVISFAVVFIKYLYDDTFTSRDEFEEAFGINVLVCIPDVSIGRRKS